MIFNARGPRRKAEKQNKPRTLLSLGNAITFYYDANHNRILESCIEDGASKLKTMVGGLYEEVRKGGQTTRRKFIPTPSGVIGLWESNGSGATTARHLYHKDHLGSTVATTDMNGNPPSEQHAYDLWGLPVSHNDWTVSHWNNSTSDPLLHYPGDRGYTGHEMLASLQLIHMNGRIYDPVIGRFLSADPLVQAPFNLQSYNRYSYVLNSPLKYTDPSGYFFKRIGKKIGINIARAIAYYTGTWGAAAFEAAKSAYTAKNSGAGWLGVTKAALGGAYKGFTRYYKYAGGGSGSPGGGMGGSYPGGQRSPVIMNYREEAPGGEVSADDILGIYKGFPKEIRDQILGIYKEDVRRIWRGKVYHREVALVVYRRQAVIDPLGKATVYDTGWKINRNVGPWSRVDERTRRVYELDENDREILAANQRAAAHVGVPLPDRVKPPYNQEVHVFHNHPFGSPYPTPNADYPSDIRSDVQSSTVFGPVSIITITPREGEPHPYSILDINEALSTE